MLGGPWQSATLCGSLRLPEAVVDFTLKADIGLIRRARPQAANRASKESGR
jgi:hypothetical protein